MEILRIEWKEGEILVSFDALRCLFHTPCALVNVGIPLPSCRKRRCLQRQSRISHPPQRRVRGSSCCWRWAQRVQKFTVNQVPFLKHSAGLRARRRDYYLRYLLLSLPCSGVYTKIHGSVAKRLWGSWTGFPAAWAAKGAGMVEVRDSSGAFSSERLGCTRRHWEHPGQEGSGNTAGSIREQ